MVFELEPYRMLFSRTLCKVAMLSMNVLCFSYLLFVHLSIASPFRKTKGEKRPAQFQYLRSQSFGPDGMKTAEIADLFQVACSDSVIEHHRPH
jgi:hypothetical protein